MTEDADSSGVSKRKVIDVIVQPDDQFRLGDFLTQSLNNVDWTEFRASVAFVKRSGTKHLKSALAAFSQRASVSISAGIDSGGTSLEGLQDLISAVLPAGKLWIYHNANSSTFHPKVFLFKNSGAADLVIGSGNLTEGGLYTNYEAGVRFKLDLANTAQRSVLLSVEAALDRWSAALPGVCFALDGVLLKKLVDLGKVPSEAMAKETEERGSADEANGSSGKDSLFKAIGVRAAPRVSAYSGATKSSRGKIPTGKTIKEARKGSVASTPATAATGVSTKTFLMTLQKTDVGYGQLTSGKSRRSPELFVPIGAVDADPTFWDWPNKFVIDNAWATKHSKWIASKKVGTRRPARPLQKMDRDGVKIRLVKDGSIVSAVIWYNPKKVDLRIRDERLRSAGKIGDILVFKVAVPGSAHDYEFEVVAPTDSGFAALNARCKTEAAANSKKRYGYL